MHQANEGQCYSVTSSLIGWVHSRNDPCCCLMAPSHYLNQCWLKTTGIHASAISQKMHRYADKKMNFLDIFMDLPGDNELMKFPSNCCKKVVLSKTSAMRILMQKYHYHTATSPKYVRHTSADMQTHSFTNWKWLTIHWCLSFRTLDVRCMFSVTCDLYLYNIDYYCL